jgi:hypothetical protein
MRRRSREGEEADREIEKGVNDRRTRERREDDRATKRKDKKERCLYLYSAPFGVDILVSKVSHWPSRPVSCYGLMCNLAISGSHLCSTDRNVIWPLSHSTWP